MPIDARDWPRIAQHFDALAMRSPSERDGYLVEHHLPADVRACLDQLLAAHDATDPLLLDRAIDDIVGELGVRFDAGSADAIRAEARVAGRRFGPWRALEEIGRGGMGVVLRGERADGQFQRIVAIKLLSPERFNVSGQARLQSEIRLLAELDHPDIARLLDGGVDEEGMAYLVMEHFQGRPITAHCQALELDLRRRVELLRRTAAAVAYSHRRLVVHCDIKPSNVLASEDGQIKLIDFGIAARMQKDARRPSPFLRHCSPGYAAPEQLAGAAPAIGHDLFALGALLFELLTDQPIRSASSTTRILLGQSPVEATPSPSQLTRRSGVAAGGRAGPPSGRRLTPGTSAGARVGS